MPFIGISVCLGGSKTRLLNKNMLKVLINAYAVSPNWGSEPGMGWNWIINLARYCELYVITEGEWSKEIQDAVDQARRNGKDVSGHLTLEQAERLHFYYIPVPEKVRRMCWNQGDWRFYYYYRKWQKKALEVGRKIVEQEDIDIVHQLNMIGYREPGELWRIVGKPFVWGPFGGCELMPVAYLHDEGIRIRVVTILKNCLNSWQIHHSPRVRKAMCKADAIFNATKGVNETVKKLYRPDAFLLNETGCYVKGTTALEHTNKGTFDVMWVGKFDFRKQLGLALNIIAKLKDCKGLRLHVCGNGSNKDVARYHQMCMDLGIQDLVVWHGVVPNAKVQQMMQNSDLLLFTSIMEGTPHVVMEALGNNLPTLCIDTCGQGDCVNSKCGFKVPLSNPNQTSRDMAAQIRGMYEHPEKLTELKQNCRLRQEELSWESKVRYMLGIYQSLVK